LAHAGHFALRTSAFVTSAIHNFWESENVGRSLNYFDTDLEDTMITPNSAGFFVEGFEERALP
jgi:hypothetical protein